MPFPIYKEPAERVKAIETILRYVDANGKFISDHKGFTLLVESLPQGVYTWTMLT